jgi:hypothetical protein
MKAGDIPGSNATWSPVRKVQGEKDAELTVSQIHTAIEAPVLLW